MRARGAIVSQRRVPLGSGVEGVEALDGLDVLLDQAEHDGTGLLTFVNWPTTWPTGLNATSTVSSGYLCVAATAMPETMYCSGIPSGSGLSGRSHASVQSLRSIRAGLPVNERLRTVSRLVALT